MFTSPEAAGRPAGLYPPDPDPKPGRREPSRAMFERPPGARSSATGVPAPRSGDRPPRGAPAPPRRPAGRRRSRPAPARPRARPRSRSPGRAGARPRGRARGPPSGSRSPIRSIGRRRDVIGGPLSAGASSRGGRADQASHRQDRRPRPSWPRPRAAPGRGRRGSSSSRTPGAARRSGGPGAPGGPGRAR